MIKLSVLLKRPATMSRQEFLSYWQDVQIPALMSVPECKQLVRKMTCQLIVQEQPIGFQPPRWDGVAEAWFDDLESALQVCYSKTFARIMGPVNDKFSDKEKSVGAFFSEERNIDLSLYS